MRVYGYTRVSGAEQGRTGTSLDGQRAEIERHCAANGLPAPDIRVEVESAGAEKIERRAVLRALLADAAAGDLVLVCKVDRWSRDIVYAVQSVRALVARGVGWVSIGEGIDARTAQGDSTLGIMSWVADQERIRIRERTVLRRRALRDEGRYVEGLPPIGYERGQGNILRIVPADAAIVRDVFRRCIAGEPLRAICAAVAAEHAGRHGWDRSTIRRMIRSRVYLGEVTTSTRAWVASHEPIIDRVTWERAQRALSSRRHVGPRAVEETRTHGWLLRGLATCARCGSPMSAAYGSNMRAAGNYYKCRARCGARFVHVAPADEAVASATQARLAELLAELSAPHARAASSPRAAPDFAAWRARLARRRERTVDLAADGAIDRADFKRRLADIDRDVGKLAVEEAAYERERAAERPEVRARVLADVHQMARAWASATVPERRAVVEELAAEVAIAREEEPQIEWRTVEALLVD